MAIREYIVECGSRDELVSRFVRYSGIFVGLARIDSINKSFRFKDSIISFVASAKDNRLFSGIYQYDEFDKLVGDLLEMTETDEAFIDGLIARL